MTKEELFELYKKEREYQRQIFGYYSSNPSLNLASFIILVENYIKKVKENYVTTWSEDLPPWLLETREFNEQGTAPVKSYEDLVKLFALAGAALESFAIIDIKRWREEGVKDKWK